MIAALRALPDAEPKPGQTAERTGSLLATVPEFEKIRQRIEGHDREIKRLQKTLCELTNGDGEGVDK